MENVDLHHPDLRRILIVDDHRNTAVMLARVLDCFDKTVKIETAGSGEEALEIIGYDPVEVLITDFLLPGMNGLDLISKLKRGREPRHTVLMTAYDNPGLELLVQRLRVNKYLLKPIEPEVLRDLVEGFLNKSHPEEPVMLGDAGGWIPTILIADDYPDNVRLLTRRLETGRYKLITAADGEETLKKIREEKPDLILLDVNMPLMDGFQVLAEVRADPETAHIPVILITAKRITPSDIHDGLSLGADDYIVKPIDWRELAAWIKTKLRVKQAEDELRWRAREAEIRGYQALVGLAQITRRIDCISNSVELFDQLPGFIRDGLGAPAAALWLVSGGKLMLKSFDRAEIELPSPLLELGPQQAFEMLQPTQFSFEKPAGSGNGADRTGSNCLNYSTIAVPILSKGEPAGVLSIYKAETKAVQESDRLQLEILAAFVGSRIDRIDQAA